MNRHGEDESCILWVGNLDSKATEEILFGAYECFNNMISSSISELFLQAGPLISVKKPKDKTFAFVTFKVKTFC